MFSPKRCFFSIKKRSSRKFSSLFSLYASMTNEHASRTSLKRLTRTFVSLSMNALTLPPSSGKWSVRAHPRDAHPGRPALPDLCTYDSESFGNPQWMTSSTPGRSIPREATSVATMMSISRLRASESVVSRWFCGKLECNVLTSTLLLLLPCSFC